MPQSYDIMIRNGWLRGEDTATRDIAVGDGKIVEISAALAGNAEPGADWIASRADPSHVQRPARALRGKSRLKVPRTRFWRP